MADVQELEGTSPFGYLPRANQSPTHKKPCNPPSPLLTRGNSRSARCTGERVNIHAVSFPGDHVRYHQSPTHAHAKSCNTSQRRQFIYRSRCVVCLPSARDEGVPLCVRTPDSQLAVIFFQALRAELDLSWKTFLSPP